MYEDYKDEAKYINSLSDEHKEWLNTFLQAYYHRSKDAMDKIKMPLLMRRSRYNQHRGVVRDIYNKKNKVNPDSDTSCPWEDFKAPDVETGEGLVREQVRKNKRSGKGC